MDWSFVGCAVAFRSPARLNKETWHIRSSVAVLRASSFDSLVFPSYQERRALQTQHTTSVCGKSFMVENLAVEILCFWSISWMRHNKRSYFGFHSRLRKCWLSHSSLRFWWRIIMKWIRAPYYSCVRCSFSVLVLLCFFRMQFSPGKLEGSFSVLTATSRLGVMHYVFTAWVTLNYFEMCGIFWRLWLLGRRKWNKTDG